MFPHERSLVKRMQDKPFVLLGVNSDGSKKELKAVMKLEQITWRSFWDGGSTTGPIAKKWGIRGWPTLVVIDSKGVVRQVFPKVKVEGHSDAVLEALKSAK